MGSLRSTSPQVVALPSGSSSNAGTTGYTFWIKGTLRTAPAGLTGLLGTAASTNSNGFAMNAALQLRAYTAGQNRYGTGNDFFEVGVYHHYRLEHDAGGAWRAYRDDMVTPVATGSFSASTFFTTLNQIHRSSSASTMYGEWDLEELGITSASFSETYNADLSGGSGNILPTVSGNNQGALNTPSDTPAGSWPSDNSQWIGFGGATITAAIAATMPQMSVAAAAGVVAPTVSASISFNMPQLSVSASAGVAAPGIGGSVVFAMPQMSVTSNADVTAPVIAAGVAFTMPQMSVAISGNVVAVGNSASIAFAMPQMSIAASASSSVPVFATNVSAVMPQFAVSVAAGVQSLSIDASLAFSMPQMQVSISGSSIAPTLSASVSFTMPQFTVQAFSGGLVYYESSGAHIEYVAQSTHLEYINQSTHIEWRA